MAIKRIINRAFNLAGLEISRVRREHAAVRSAFQPDMEEEFRCIHAKCVPFTMTSVLRMYALFNATRYLVRRQIAGDVVECGVWKGGSAMVAVLTLIEMGDTSRDIYLFDTFEGMSPPTDKDRKLADNLDVQRKWQDSQTNGHNQWCYSSLEEVKQNLLTTGYPAERLHFIKGKVEDTIPGTCPDRIALLRLDTDFYESTYHEFVHLYPNLVRQGVLILDDYGTWQGAKEATEQYCKENGINLLLNKIDKPGRIAIKC